MRRLYIHSKHYENVKQHLIKFYKQVKIGNPLDNKNMMGPMHT